MYTLFDGENCAPWKPVDLKSNIAPIVFRWGSSLFFLAVIGVNSQGNLVQR